MKRGLGWNAGIGYAAMFVVLAYCTRQVQAGWTGSMNGTGFGWASVNIVTGKGSTNVSTPIMSFPSATIPFASGYAAFGGFPRDASLSDVAQVVGSSGYVWHATTVGYNGDSTDNSNIDSQVTIAPYDCPALEMDSVGALSTDGLSGSITVNAFGTPGTGLLLRGYEDTNGTPSDLGDLISHSLLKFSVLLVGPFDLNTSNCTALVIPFTTQTGNQNLYFVTDGEAKSTPLQVTCSVNPVVIGACAPVTYPQPQISGGCGAVQVTYDPAPDALPLGVVTTVTVTAFDQAQNTNQCTFQVDTTAKAFTVSYPANVVLGCGDSLTYPTPQISGGCGPFTFSYDINPGALVPGVPTTVTATVTDSKTGLSVTSQFTALRDQLSFNGFFSPIGGTGGSYQNPFVWINAGSKIPVKFQDSCQGTAMTTGAPTILIVDSSGKQITNGNFQFVQNVWHFNWDTTGLRSKAVYQLVVTLQDGVTQEIVFVGLH